nr:MAG TPA: hypothetical protein [Caudoviricetes sp.]
MEIFRHNPFDITTYICHYICATNQRTKVCCSLGKERYE